MPLLELALAVSNAAGSVRTAYNLLENWETMARKARWGKAAEVTGMVLGTANLFAEFLKKQPSH